MTRSITGPVFLESKKSTDYWIRLGNSTKKLVRDEMIENIRDKWPEQFIKPAESSNRKTQRPIKRTLKPP